MSQIYQQLLYTAQQTRQLDQLAIGSLPISGFELMQRAGRCVFDHTIPYCVKESDTLHVFCGAGNNAGDGYIVAGLALQAGYIVKVYAVSAVTELKGDALTAFRFFVDRGGAVFPVPENLGPGVVVDALFGTGLDKAVSGKYLDVVRLINTSSLAVISADLPSGLHADTGCVLGQAVSATKTISFIARKQGLYTADGPAYSGELVFDDLGVSAEVLNSLEAEACLFSMKSVASLKKPRKKNAHKGNFGHVLLVGGNHGYTGAIRLAGEAALRSGAGLVSIATRRVHASLINLARPELMCHAVENQSEFQALSEQSSVLAIGPGLGQDKWSQQLFEKTIELDLPMVIDADGLNLLARSPRKQQNWVLTPHPGEAGRLLNCSTADIQGDRFKAVKKLQQQYGGVVVLKGSGSLVYDGSGKVYVCAAGNPGMASGGMGDVLTGMISSLIGQNLSLFDAAVLAVATHASAADTAAERGEKGLLASDLFEPIRKLLNEY